VSVAQKEGHHAIIIFAGFAVINLDRDLEKIHHALLIAQRCASAYTPGSIEVKRKTGGDGARKVAAKLGKKGFKVDLLFLFDPIGKPWHVGPGGTEGVSGNVLKAIDIYQETDTRGWSVGLFSFKLQGYKIKPGTNIEWIARDKYLRARAHDEIVKDRVNLLRLYSAVWSVLPFRYDP